MCDFEGDDIRDISCEMSWKMMLSAWLAALFYLELLCVCTGKLLQWKAGYSGG